MTLRPRIVTGLVLLVASDSPSSACPPTCCMPVAVRPARRSDPARAVPLVPATSGYGGGGEAARPRPAAAPRPTADRGGQDLWRAVDGFGNVHQRLPLQLDRHPTDDHRDVAERVGRIYTSGAWRILVTRSPRNDGDLVVVAIPPTEVRSPLHRLVALEAIGSLALLAILAAGAWFILRRGLRPLEYDGHLGPVDHRRRPVTARRAGRRPQ